MPLDPKSVPAVVVEKRLLNVLSRTELVRDGELERVLSDDSGGGLVGLGSAPEIGEPRDCMPGNRILPALAPASTSSSAFLRYAAEPLPPSGVCLNQVGSLEPNDSAICARDSSLLPPPLPLPLDDSMLESGVESCDSLVGLRAGSGVPRGDLAAFSDASHESGLLPSPPRDFGLCCHDSVPERANCVAVGGGVDDVDEPAIASGVSLPMVVFIGVGLVEGLSWPRGEAGVLSRDDRAYCFSGDIDLARSIPLENRNVASVNGIVQ
jgi:hypothetical protein